MIYERLAVLEDTVQNDTTKTWKEVTEKELREYHEECIEADINTPDYQKRNYEERTGNTWVDTTDDFEKFIAQMIEDGVLRVKSE